MLFANLAARLAQARSDVCILRDDPSPLIASVEDAYKVQSDLIELANADVRGWKVTALTPADQAKYGSTRPVAGPLLGPCVHPNPCKLALKQFIAPLIECEIAFVLGADLPPRERPYAHDEIAAAVMAVVPGIEVVDSRVAASATELARLADAMMNGAYVVGAPATAWRDLDFINLAVSFTASHGERQSGSGARIPGGPFAAVVALANAQPLPGPGLRKGQVITTGSCTPPVPLRAGDYVAEFGKLGQVRLSVG